MNILTEISFTGSYLFISGFFTTLALFLLILQWRKRSKAHALLRTINFSSPRSPYRTIFKISCGALGFIFLFLTFMRPCWGKKEEEIKHEGRELFIALDISRSMLAEDIIPSRLQVAKEKIKKLLHLLRSERVGLILFSGTAFVQCPLTTDWAAFLLFLDHVDAHTISSGTTACDQAIKKSLQAFENSNSSKNKILVMFTDGEDFSTNLDAIKTNAKKANLHIFTIGVGTSHGAPIPLLNNEGSVIGHQKNEDGTIVISRLDEEMLKTLASDCGGVFVPFTIDDNDIHSIKKYIDQYEKEHLGEHHVEKKQERYHYTAALSFLFFLIEWLL